MTYVANSSSITDAAHFYLINFMPGAVTFSLISRGSVFTIIYSFTSNLLFTHKWNRIHYHFDLCFGTVAEHKDRITLYYCYYYYSVVFINIIILLINTYWIMVIMIIIRGGWFRHWATSPNVAGSILIGVTEIFHWHNPSGRTVALGSTQPLTEMSTRCVSGG